MNWDAAHYLAIAQHGYPTIANTPFFPLQPLLIRAGATFVGFPNAAIVVTWLAFGVAVWGIVDVAGRLTTPRGAVLGALLFAWSPVSVFFVAAYGESLFVALTVWCLHFCLDRRWWPAALAAGAASAVVPQGAFAAVMVVVGILLAERGARRVLLAVGCGVVSELGFIGYALFSRVRFGNPLEFQAAASEFWHSKLTYPFHIMFSDIDQIRTTSSPHLVLVNNFILVVDAAAPLIAVAVAGWAIVRCRTDRRWVLATLFFACGALLGIATTSQWANSESRFLLCLFTVYLVGAAVLESLARRSLLAAAAVLVPCAALGLYVEGLFHMAYWVT